MHLFEIEYDDEVIRIGYPLDLRDVDIRKLIDTFEESYKNGAYQIPYAAINEYEFSFLIKNEHKCDSKDEQSEDNSKKESIRLLIIVKSALSHKDRRDGIRNSWGREDRFSDVVIKRVFIVGSCSMDVACQNAIDTEMQEHGDLVQVDFIDAYFNNTLKTMSSMRWTVKYCPHASYILLIDDDYYLSLKNLLKFINNVTDYDPGQRYLYAGFVFPSSRPMRHLPSKWFVSLDEWPYNRYPPYVSAGAILLSRQTLRDMFWVSFFTKHFRFDDIYVAILAHKLQVQPTHSEEFHFWSRPSNYTIAIASHGFNDPKELVNIWLEQKTLGHA